MPNKSDAQLLREYAASGAESAFGEIVSRHTNLIYSAALRQTGSPELAREIAQSVFTDLARKARTLAKELTADASLAGWLYRGTRYAALNSWREERRRQAREKIVMEHFNIAPATEDDWARVAPVLDEAMNELSDADREAVLLRYFQNQDYQTVGRALGVSDDTAQKRVSRAVDRLREFFAKRGVTVGTSGLVLLISANAVLTAPAGLSAAIAATALAGTTIFTAATATAGKAIVMTTTQKVLIAVALAAAIGTGIYEASQASTLRAQVQTLRQQQQASFAELERLRAEKERAAKGVQADADELKQLRSERAELLRLRGQVGVMRQQIAEARQRMSERAADTNDVTKRWAFGEIKPKGEWQDAGLASPLAALETFWWSAANTRFERMKQSIVFDRWTNTAPASDLYATREAEFNAGFLEGLEGAGLSIVSLNRANMATNRAEIEVEVSGHRTAPDGTSIDIRDKQQFRLFNIDGDWKIGRDEKTIHLKLFEDDSDAVAKMMLSMPAEILEKIRADPRLPLRTLQAFEALKAKAGK